MAITPHAALAQAERLYAAGYSVAACVMARLAVETHVQELSRAYGLPVKQRFASTLVNLMCGMGHISGDDRRLLCRLLRLGSKAAHGVDLDAERTIELLVGARRVVHEDLGSPFLAEAVEPTFAVAIG